MKKIIICLALFCLLTAAPALAQNLPAAEQAAVIRRVETYLNGITTMQSRFTQANSDGTLQSGAFYLSRPGRLRFQYDPPNGDYIVADGLLVHYWDDAVKNYSNAPIGSTLADFLLRKRITLTNDVKVTGIRRPTANKLVITIVQKKNPEAGDLRLLLTENPLRLDKWRVTDATGQVTEVTLTNSQTGLYLDPKLFVFKAPKGYEGELHQ